MITNKPIANKSQSALISINSDGKQIRFAYTKKEIWPTLTHPLGSIGVWFGTNNNHDYISRTMATAAIALYQQDVFLDPIRNWMKINKQSNFAKVLLHIANNFKTVEQLSKLTHLTTKQVNNSLTVLKHRFVIIKHNNCDLKYKVGKAGTVSYYCIQEPTWPDITMNFPDDYLL